ncbi:MULTISPECIES: Rrf2 family transcriptional regulator [Variovorax]|jgi:Rrf2 family transcriptional regulator, iron-sulfur cluster assembly transcription factor|uniref:Rrf2 family transcriptional regulator n=1 Tax=Variovorax TaxID=34072 RepID=UPI00086CE270|nr:MULTISPECIES: Rrf2 family transcriptional regulator [Variovorax]MBN8755514.1 Rrf2 family transcriptional regulator [Variovorax sp.]ODU14141.1 MAG: DNA-binding protein [Variovorax sp. SCN 67-85]ODV19920.1 MAG: DNA-binding protein [Variovorax sp. SCN 67-20]OJZ12618.1 MAG: DNA-binding protein [Variovorax sp. 67-131]UKI09363.1 Rrf2 family transcriptional regulator [Variovorax paradoxus]
MRLTTKGGFAVTAMIDVALREQAGPVALASIAKRQHIARSSLEALFSKLRQHALVKATRGPGGGYTLMRKASEITVADILFSVDGQAAPEAEGAPPHGKATTNAAGDSGCYSTEALWASANHHVMEFLDSVTLQSLVDDQLAKGVRVEEEAPRKKEPQPRPVPSLRHVNAPNSVFAWSGVFAKR